MLLMIIKRTVFLGFGEHFITHQWVRLKFLYYTLLYIQ